ncbi:hypothetical protein Tco_0839504 [Tanacetum coccineum]|uniref:Uncharacterized protein n=1 Tax=Tanacetum coccineum TaxID=301880 RepID=A0ABQ5ATE2_9ASTR
MLESRFQENPSSKLVSPRPVLRTSGPPRKLRQNKRPKHREKDDAKPPISTDTFGSNGGNDSRTSGSNTPAKEVVDNGIESEVVVGLPEEFQEGDMVDALSRVEQKSLKNWKELDNELEDRKVERDAKREGEPTILEIFGSDRGITIWDPGIKIFLDNTMKAGGFK